MAVTYRAGTLAAVMTVAFALAQPAALAQTEAAPNRLAVFATHDAGSQRSIGYDVIDTVLKAFVVDEGSTTTVRYGVLKGEGQRAIAQLMAAFAQFPPTTLNRDEQLAFWLNLRLLMVLHATGEAFPAARPEALLRPGSSFLTGQLVTIDKLGLSIADVDRILLDNWRTETNLVFGLVIPAKSGPAFPTTAFRGASVRSALAAAGRAYVNRSGVVKAKADLAIVPDFLQQHRDHLGGSDAAVLAHLTRHAAPKLAARLAPASRIEVRSDWQLNVRTERSLADLSPVSGFGAPGGNEGGRLGGGS